MKKIYRILTLYFIVFSALLGFGQSKKFQIGVEGGPSLTILSHNGYFLPGKSYIDIGLGGMAGITFQYNINAKIGIKTDLSYERKGCQNKSGSFHERFDYLVVPMLFKINLGQKSRTFFNVGPYFGYLLSGSIVLDGQVYTNQEVGYKKFDFGFTMGFGGNIHLSNQFGLLVEIRNNLGMFNVKEGVEGKLYHNSTIILFGFVYNLDIK
jgi:hypothetical protein